MTFRNPESESDFHFPTPELVNHSHGFYSVPGNYRDFLTFNILSTVVDYLWAREMEIGF